MRRGVLSFGAYLSTFPGPKHEAEDAYADHMDDLRSGNADLGVSLVPEAERVDWAKVARETEEIRRAARAYVFMLEIYHYPYPGFTSKDFR